MVAAGFHVQEVGDIVEQGADPHREVLRFALSGEMADLLDDGVGPGALRGDFSSVSRSSAGSIGPLRKRARPVSAYREMAVIGWLISCASPRPSRPGC